jgi:putative transposase
MVTAPLRRELLRWLQTKGPPEQRSLAIVGMIANVLQYKPQSGRNTHLREKVVTLVQRHRLKRRN